MRRDDPQYAPRVTHAVTLLQGPHKLEILCATRWEPTCLTQLKRLPPFVPERELRDSLNALLFDGIVARRSADRDVADPGYSFSELFKELRSRPFRSSGVLGRILCRDPKRRHRTSSNLAREGRVKREN